MPYRKVRDRRAGRGGVRCRCCGPSRRYRKAFNRAVRRVLRRTELTD